MLQYSLEVGICWAILYLVYIAFLRRETFFAINRWYLLSSLIIGLLIPVLRTIPMAFQDEAVIVNEALYFISAGPEFIAANIVAEAEAPSILTINNFLLLIYSLGVLFVGSRLVLGLVKIKDLYVTGSRTRKDSFTLVETNRFHLPFSFLNCVFFSKEMPINDNIEKILKHELTHVQSWHTLDVLFTEILQVLFWFNPLIILYKKAIKESHEYVADASVLQDTSQKIYGQILLRQSQSGLQIALANHFFHSHIKNRLTMMKQKKSKWPALMKYLFAMPVILLLMVLFQSQGMPSINAESGNIPSFIPVAMEDLKSNIKDLKFIKNSGVDIEVESGAIVYATADGRLATKCITDDMGHTLTIEHSTEYSTHYAKLGEVFINGNEVKRGQAIGRVTKSKIDRFSELHYEVIKNGNYVNPKDYLINSMVDELDDSYTVPQVFPQRLRPVPFEQEDIYFQIQNNKDIELLIDGKIASREEVLQKRDVLNISSVSSKFEIIDNVNFNSIQGRINASDPNLAKDFEALYRSTDHDKNIMQTVTKFQELLQSYANKHPDAPDYIKYQFIKIGNYMGMKIGFDQNSFRFNQLMFVVPDNLLEDYQAGKLTEYNDLIYGDKLFDVSYRSKLMSALGPRFPGCENMEGSAEEIAECSQKVLFQYIARNINYPAEQRNNGIEGLAVAQFVVDKNGEVRDEKMVKDVDGAFEESLLSVINKMRQENIKWSPGRRNGKPTDIVFTFAVKYLLEGPNYDYGDRKSRLKNMGDYNGDLPLLLVTGLSEANTNQKDTIPKSTPQLVTKGEIFKVVEQMPRFPGCEDVEGTNTDKEDCAKKNMLEFIYTNLNYPAAAREEGIQGTNVIQFVIATNGSITDINLVRDIGGGTGPVTEAVIKKMADTYTWTPGYQRGKAVNVLYTLPVKFKLEGDYENTEVFTTYELYQNEPNPFKTHTDISFVLPNSGQASISVYNVAGEVVKTVKDQFKKGINRVRLTKADLGEVDGPLYYQLESGEFTKTMKMIISQLDKEQINTLEDKADSSLENEKPLLVIDGVKKSKLFNDDIMKGLMPNEIESINVIKDEKAILLYGQEGRHGVLEITTKEKSKRKAENSNTNKVEEIFKVVEEMPRFPGCEDIDGSKEAKEECAKSELLKFIYTNIKYPKEARENGYEGVAVVQFVIDEKGNVGDEKVVRDIEGAFAESIYTVIDEMRLQNKVWTPGKQRGKAVKLLFTLPVRFKLEGDHEEDFKQKVKQEQVEDPNDIETSVIAYRPEKTLSVTTLTLSEIQFRYNTNEAGTVNYTVYNMEGKLLKRNSTAVQAGSNVKNITLDNVVPGIYVLRLQQGKEDFSRKVLINN